MAKAPADPKAALLSKVATLVRKLRPKSAARAEEFARQLYRAVSLEDLSERQPADLAGAAASLYDFAAKRAPGKPSVRILNPVAARDGFSSPNTVVQVANDDMPFLVDSISMALNRHGRVISLTVHPIMPICRDKQGRMTDLLSLEGFARDRGQAKPESVMHIEFDRETRAEVLAELQSGIEKALADVRAAVTDWRAMRAKCGDIISGLQTSPPPLKLSDVAEGKRFLEWLNENHFTYLGYREYELKQRDGEDVLEPVAGSGLGILRDRPAKPAAKKVSKSFMVLPKHVRAAARAKELLIVTKANSVATVHRPSYMDYVGIKRFDKQGRVIGEQRFLGLFTSSAYQAEPIDIPLIAERVEQVMLRSKLPTSSHGGKALLHILETFPRDELFQSTTDELSVTAMGVLALQERQRVKLFARRDAFGRFFSCMVYVPRDRYSTKVREKIQGILMDAFGGVSIEAQTQISESVLARLHLIVHVKPWQFPEFDLRQVEQRIAEAVRGWDDAFLDALRNLHGEEQAIKLAARYGRFFPGAYRSDEAPRAAALDCEHIGRVLAGEPLAMRLFHEHGAPAELLRFKVFRREQPIPISDAVPMLEHMGLKVIGERPYELDFEDGSIVWIQDFEMCHSLPDCDLERLRAHFNEAFAKTFAGEAEDDGFNRLVLVAGLSWRQVALLRAVGKYLQQAGLPFSQAYVERALANNPGIARILVKLFETRLDPALKKRDQDYVAAKAELQGALEGVTSLDEDRILRAYRNVIKAILRTNFWQRTKDGAHKPVMSFKLNPSRIPELPLPRPMFEIWVYAPKVEGVHLRFGMVARGGLRWSDRREDFRTEVLGLVKAQQVKNTVIVPVGAKGGFFVKRPPLGGDREAVLASGIACYQSFLRGLLDITDNIVDGKIVPPKDCMRHDGDDPYLVVAADKGTATFSDIANGISAEYGHWLGDAFASGGSVGYDHKGMGITAKGGWESVKRHFREMGRDCQREDFTCVGIGDMSGDVFGNGLLLSKHTKLLAAFDHRHIFLDPNPDPAKSFKERERMFKLPRSSWADYDAALISKGGGVFPRAAKSITLSREAANALGLEAGSFTPVEVMRAILKAPVDLLWNGGIGTYVKSASETNAEVGDRATDALRINGTELRCKVVGEGGNLGMTQRGRVEYALAGGRLNTDFIDNSAGVDCSDHEVNIKILLGLAADRKGLTTAKRNALLASMTDEVAELVLRDNYLQSQALSVGEAQAPNRITEHGHLIRVLEREGRLNRALESLPSEEELTERRKQGKGLTRPELAVLLSYSKIGVFDALLASDVPEDPYLAQELAAYFPRPLQQRYGDLMQKHRLKREIIATAITNSMVNRMGSTFAMRLMEESGVTTAQVARAYTVAREVFAAPWLWQTLEAMDETMPAGVQTELMVQIGRVLRLATHWFLEHADRNTSITAAVSAYRGGIREYMDELEDLLPPDERQRFAANLKRLEDAGLPPKLARPLAGADWAYAGLDIVEIARGAKLTVPAAARAWFELGSHLNLGWMRTQIEHLQVDGHWQAIARGSLRDNLYTQQRRLAAALLAHGRKKGGGNGAADPKAWLAGQGQRAAHLERVLTDMRAIGALDFATASVALQEISKLG
jgi:glutamate dehydrogenase